MTYCIKFDDYNFCFKTVIRLYKNNALCDICLLKYIILYYFCKNYNLLLFWLFSYFSLINFEFTKIYNFQQSLYFVCYYLSSSDTPHQLLSLKETAYSVMLLNSSSFIFVGM